MPLVPGTRHSGDARQLLYYPTCASTEASAALCGRTCGGAGGGDPLFAAAAGVRRPMILMGLEVPREIVQPA
jgi:hypothetical protein